MTTTAANIATKLNILESAIVKIDEWSNVLFVVVKGLGARFVSKKLKVDKKMEVEYKGSYKQETALQYAPKIKQIALEHIDPESDPEFAAFVNGLHINHWANYFINGEWKILSDAQDALEAAWDAYETGDMSELYPIN